MSPIRSLVVVAILTSTSGAHAQQDGGAPGAGSEAARPPLPNPTPPLPGEVQGTPVAAEPSVPEALKPSSSAAGRAGASPRLATTVTVGVTGGSVYELEGAVRELMDRAFSNLQEVDASAIQLTLRLDREVGPKVRLGGAVSLYDGSRGYVRDGVRVGSSDERAWVFLANLALAWYRSPRVEVYSGFGLGIGFWNMSGTLDGRPRSDSSGDPAWQLTALGLSTGGQRARVVLELGFGYEGMLVLGLQARF